jgi:hypothetical protein
VLQTAVKQMPPKKSAEAASAAGAASTAAATKNPWWKQPEIVVLLNAVRSVLPLGEYHWQSVATQYNSTRPNGSVERNTDSCKTKFKALKNTRKPTGVAGMPWDVNEAKEIQRLIEAKMCTAEMDDPSAVDGDGDEVAVKAEVPNGDSSESEGEEWAPVEGEEGAPVENATDSQSSTSQPQQSTTPNKRTSSASVTGSPAEKALDGVPQRLGVVAHQAGVVASTATSKRIKLEKQIAEEKQQRAASADVRNLMISSMMAQQQQQHQLQMQQNQQMQMMMMMMMMSKMCGVPLSELQLPMQMPPPPSNPPPPQHNE